MEDFVVPMTGKKADNIDFRRCNIKFKQNWRRGVKDIRLDW